MVQAESRQFYRKDTYLEGLYKRSAPPATSGKIVVTNLSMHGCRFDAPLSHNLQPGDRVGLAFSLDNARGTLIRKEAFVRQISGHSIGCEFIVLPDTFDPDLGFYLRNP